jgi:hypothetical protein
LLSEATFLDPWESFSLSDSPPSLSVPVGVPADDSCSAGVSFFVVPKILAGVVLLGAKMDEAGADAEPAALKRELGWDADVLGANLIGVVPAFQV